MTVDGDFLAIITAAARQSPGPRVIPWPMPGKLGVPREFQTFAEWREFILAFRLPAGVPENMTDAFDRALKIALLAWVDFDLMVAAEMTALSALEHALKDCYLDKVAERRPSFAALLKFMIEQDGLTDDKVPLVRRCGGRVIHLLTGKIIDKDGHEHDHEPTLADMRNNRAHGNPFGSGYQAGLLELIRDLMAYAYRDLIAQTAIFARP